MDRHKTPEVTKRLVRVLLAPDELGRPMVGPPGTPADRVKILRGAYAKTMSDPELLAEAKRQDWEVSPTRGKELEATAKKLVVQPPEMIEQVKKFWRSDEKQGALSMKRIICVPLFLFLLWSSNLHAQADFYKGKTVRIVVGYSPGGANDLWARTVARYWTRYVPGNPEFIVQNMPGAGSMVAANYVYGVGKPDGLNLGLIAPALFFDQLVGRKEVQFDWAKFAWIGSPEEVEDMLFMRSDSPYKTVEDIRKAAVPPRCGASGTGTTGYYFPKLLEEVLGLKFNIIVGYPGMAETDLAVEKGELHCRATTTSSFFGREPSRTWAKTGFVQLLVVGGMKRDSRAPDVATIWELMEREKTPEIARRVAKVVLSSNFFGRPILGSPGIPADRIKVLRESFMKTMNDPELLAEAQKRGWEPSPVSGEKLEALAREVIAQPPEVIKRMNAVLGH